MDFKSDLTGVVVVVPNLKRKLHVLLKWMFFKWNVFYEFEKLILFEKYQLMEQCSIFSCFSSDFLYETIGNIYFLLCSNYKGLNYALLNVSKIVNFFFIQMKLI